MCVYMYICIYVYINYISTWYIHVCTRTCIPLIQNPLAAPLLNVLMMLLSYTPFTSNISQCLSSGAFRKLVDITFVGAMGPPGGGRNPITPRFSRHFNYVSFTELEDSSKFRIFSTIVASWLGSFSNAENLVRNE